jgi:hypothetical protein
MSQKYCVFAASSVKAAPTLAVMCGQTSAKNIQVFCVENKKNIIFAVGKKF